jgi:hypothetical protein
MTRKDDDPKIWKDPTFRPVPLWVFLAILAVVTTAGMVVNFLDCGALVCASEHRHAIDIGLVHGIGSRVLAERFGLHKDAILRHSENHLTPAMRAALLTAQQPSAIDLEELRRTESEGILAGLVASRARLLAKGDLAAGLGDMRTHQRGRRERYRKDRG